MLKRLSTLHVDLFLVALAATMSLALLVPAHGAAANDRGLRGRAIGASVPEVGEES